jgi:hydroxyethylthiazole kinase
MLTAVIAAFCAANPGKLLEAAAAAVCAMGLCGELAYEKLVENNVGTSSYRTWLIDSMSRMNAEILQGGARIESR